MDSVKRMTGTDDDILKNIDKSLGNIGESSENIGEPSENIGELHQKKKKYTLNDTQRKIIELLTENNKLSASKLAGEIGVASRNIEVNLKKLKEQGILLRCGSPKTGYWVISDK